MDRRNDDVPPDVTGGELLAAADDGAIRAGMLAPDGSCARCHGWHGRRQRCPFDAGPQPATELEPVVTVGPGQWTVGEHGGPASSGLPYMTTRSSERPPRLFLQWVAAIFCSVTLIVCLSVAGVQIAGLPEVNRDVGQSLTTIVIVGVIGLSLGVVPLYWAARSYAGFMYAALALVLITGGLAMLMIAPVVRQMNTPEIAEYRGFAALAWFGALTTLLGLALAAFCLRWSLRPEARRRIARWGRIFGAGYGVVLGVSGLAMIRALFLLLDSHSAPFEAGVVEKALVITFVGMSALVPGIILTYHGISESMGEGSSPFATPVAAFGVLAFAAVLGLGQLNMRTHSPIAAPMPALHTLAAATPGLTLAAMAGRGSLLRGIPVLGLTWRQVTLAAAVSMSVATVIAIYIEAFGAYFAIVLLLVHHGAFELARNAHAARVIIGNADFILSRNEQFAAGLIVGSLLAPVAEEFGKSLGVRLTMTPASTRAQCFLLGAMAGAAFGFLEAMSYGVGGIQDDLGDWWKIMVLRAGSTSLHVICSGLTGLGWWYWTIARRHRLSIALFGAAMLLHAGWNAAATVIGSRIFVLHSLSDDTLRIIAYSIVGVISATMIVAIPVIARALRDPPDAAALPGASPAATGGPIWSLPAAT